MAELQIRFDDGAAYERMMGTWSRLAGDIFLDWLALPPGLRWIDVGCGNGAFTELLIERCAPAEVLGIDPSEGQLAFARTRPAVRIAEFQQGDAMALPFSERRFDAAVMALVIFFVPDPAERQSPRWCGWFAPAARSRPMPGIYSGGGFPMEPIQAEMRAMGVQIRYVHRVPTPRELTRCAACGRIPASMQIETREIAVRRTFSDFEDFWTTCMLGPSAWPRSVAAMPCRRCRHAQDARARTLCRRTSAGRITYGSCANAIKGHVPACAAVRGC